MIILDLKLVILVLAGLVLIALPALWRLLAARAGRQPLSHLSPQVVEQLPFGLVLLQAAGTVGYMNGAARQLLTGQDAQLASATHEILETLSGQALQQTQRSGLLSHPTPMRWWSYPLAEATTLLVLADAGEQQRFLRQQQSFIGQLSHELRTPLTGLIAHTEIMRSQQTSEPIRRASLETITRETQRMARLVRDLLELYRLETTDDIRLQAVNLTLIVEEAMSQLYQSAEERAIQLTLEADAPLPAVVGQPDRLKQVFLNLLDNAIKYSRPADAVRVALTSQRHGVVCVIQDTGPGIAAEDLPRITERLYRARRDVEGCGLGLALVSEILRQHGARLSIKSATEGKTTGTSIRWSLPYAHDTAEP